MSHYLYYEYETSAYMMRACVQERARVLLRERSEKSSAITAERDYKKRLLKKRARENGRNIRRKHGGK